MNITHLHKYAPDTVPDNCKLQWVEINIGSVEVANVNIQGEVSFKYLNFYPRL